MKKLTIKNTFTRVSFKKVDAEMRVIDSVKMIHGKVNEKNAIKELDNEDYLTKSVKVEVLTDVFKIPYDVLEMVINASLNGGFVETEVKEEITLYFNKPIYIKSSISPLNLNKVEIVESDEVATIEKEGYSKIDNVILPNEVFTHIIKEYEVK